MIIQVLVLALVTRLLTAVIPIVAAIKTAGKTSLNSGIQIIIPTALRTIYSKSINLLHNAFPLAMSSSTTKGWECK